MKQTTGRFAQLAVVIVDSTPWTLRGLCQRPHQPTPVDRTLPLSSSALHAEFVFDEQNVGVARIDSHIPAYAVDQSRAQHGGRPRTLRHTTTHVRASCNTQLSSQTDEPKTRKSSSLSVSVCSLQPLCERL